MTSTETRSGIIFGVFAYLLWGVLAVYFKIVRAVGPLEILAHRIVWAFVVLLVVIAVSRRWPLLTTILRQRRVMILLAASTTFIAVNWFIYIWSVTHDRMVESSLGYFFNPLVNVLLGFLFLGERLLGREKVSVALAAVAVLWLTLSAGTFPWISIALAVTFGLYGLMRKLAGVTAVEGLAIETALLLPLAAAYMIHRARTGTLMFGHASRSLDLWLLAAGPLTAIPLLLFAAAVRRLRLATIGLLQYISPTLQFILAVAVYKEPFGSERAVAFVLIWIAIAIYSTAGIGVVSAATTTRTSPP
jgi:chloramphenicol-sensitive protein RarD